MSDAFAVGIVLLLLGLAIYFTMVRRAIKKRGVTRLADAPDAHRASVVEEAIRYMDQERAAKSWEQSDHELRAATFDRLRRHVRELDLPIADEALWEAVDKALVQYATASDDGFLTDTAVRVIAELRAAYSGRGDPPTLRNDLFLRLNTAAIDRRMRIDDLVIWAIVDQAIEDAEPDVHVDTVEVAASEDTETPSEPTSSTISDEPVPPISDDKNLQALPEEADMTVTNLDDLSHTQDKNLVLLKVLAGGRYETLGETFDDADEAGMHLTRELVRAYFPDWLPGAEDEAANENAYRAEGPWGPIPAEPGDPAEAKSEALEADMRAAKPSSKDALEEAAPADETTNPVPAVEPVSETETPADPLVVDNPPSAAPELSEVASEIAAPPPEKLDPISDAPLVATAVPALAEHLTTSTVSVEEGEVTIRPATVEDAAVVAGLANALDREVSDGDEPHTAASVADDMLSGQAGLVLWVAVPTDSQEPVGYALVQDMYDTDGATWITWLHDLYVNEAWRSREVGDRLMAHLALTARSVGHKGLWWGVHRNNWKAERFYRRLGAERAPIHVMGLAGSALNEAADRAA